MDPTTQYYTLFFHNIVNHNPHHTFLNDLINTFTTSMTISPHNSSHHLQKANQSIQLYLNQSTNLSISTPNQPQHFLYHQQHHHHTNTNTTQQHHTNTNTTQQQHSNTNTTQQQYQQQQNNISLVEKCKYIREFMSTLENNTNDILGSLDVMPYDYEIEFNNQEDNNINQLPQPYVRRQSK